MDLASEVDLEIGRRLSLPHVDYLELFFGLRHSASCLLEVAYDCLVLFDGHCLEAGFGLFGLRQMEAAFDLVEVDFEWFWRAGFEAVKAVEVGVGEPDFDLFEH